VFNSDTVQHVHRCEQHLSHTRLLGPYPALLTLMLISVTPEEESSLRNMIHTLSTPRPGPMGGLIPKEEINPGRGPHYWH